ncbi:hypothetical protein NDU88_002141 [Pleurodeles waltl]|uniref:Uncharacterized protein n=1 Tax=Pleurodeles waltl TaxID=8319 RepID=A0AAV7T2F6_PLEWA|nr:hypothetical protein NDU88_002141 [Pleurodeles waltl]
MQPPAYGRRISLRPGPGLSFPVPCVPGAGAASLRLLKDSRPSTVGQLAAPCPGSARIKAWSSCSVRGLAGRVGEGGSRALPPVAGGPRGPIQRSGPPAPPESRGSETTGRRSPLLTCFQFCAQGAASSSASFMPPESRDRDGAASSSSAAIRLLLGSRDAPGAGTDHRC